MSSRPVLREGGVREPGTGPARPGWMFRVPDRLFPRKRVYSRSFPGFGAWVLVCGDVSRGAVPRWVARALKPGDGQGYKLACFTLSGNGRVGKGEGASGV